jgi:ABC-type uncharacterized transport system substrate-binding protein
MKRREVITLIGGATVWAFDARAQQAGIPVIGFLSARSPDVSKNLVNWFREGLADGGYVDGRNVTIEYRWADGDYKRLQGLARELIRHPVAVIAAISGTPSALAAKSATSTVPIVFVNGGDPVTSGLVASLNKPGGNITGVTFFNTGAATKRLQIVRSLLPGAKVIVFLTNPNNPVAAPEKKDTVNAALTLGFDLKIVNASSASEFDGAFATVQQTKPNALLIASDPLFVTTRYQLIARTANLAIPVMSADADITKAGGLMSYGGSISDAYHQGGTYVSRILNGDKPADLPVMLPTKFELVINQRTSKALGITIPQTLLVAADEVIE